jgi:hypothetical protein
MYRDDPVALTHLAIAAEELGPSVAVKALLARAYQDAWDVRAEPLFAELLTLQPQTAEDFLFKGQTVAQFDNPRDGLRDIEQALRLRPSPLARLALAEASFMAAIDSGSVDDSEAAVRAADLARELLPNSDLALAACLNTRLAAWDAYSDRAGPGNGEEAAKHRAAAGRLVEAAGWRRNTYLRTGCIYYHDRTGNHDAELAYARGVWATRDFAAGSDLATLLLMTGDLVGAKTVTEEARRTRPTRGWQDLVPWVFILAEEGQGEQAYREAQALPRTPGFGFLTVGTLAWLLGKQEEARRVYAAEIAAGTVPRFHNGWYQAMARFGAGEGTPADEKALLDRAGASRLHLCEAHFQIGMRRLSKGDKAQARQHFERAVQMRAFFYFDHFWSRAFLARMDAVPGWPTWIESKK